MKFDDCHCEYARHVYGLHWMDRWYGYKKPERKHQSTGCKISDAAHDSWKLHRQTQYASIASMNTNHD